MKKFEIFYGECGNYLEDTIEAGSLEEAEGIALGRFMDYIEGLPFACGAEEIFNE